MTEIFVVAHRPFAEKVIGGFVYPSDPNKDVSAYQVDGTFCLDELQAELITDALNKAHNCNSWKVYCVLMRFDKRKP
jgi:hypothetical protein